MGRRKSWKVDEISLFQKAHAEHGDDWGKVSRVVGTRSFSQCRRYWCQFYTSSGKINTDSWKVDEISRFQKAFAEHDKDWGKVSRAVGTRTYLQCRSYCLPRIRSLRALKPASNPSIKKTTSNTSASEPKPTVGTKRKRLTSNARRRHRRAATATAQFEEIKALKADNAELQKKIEDNRNDRIAFEAEHYSPLFVEVMVARELLAANATRCGIKLNKHGIPWNVPKKRPLTMPEAIRILLRRNDKDEELTDEYLTD